MDQRRQLFAQMSRLKNVFALIFLSEKSWTQIKRFKKLGSVVDKTIDLQFGIAHLTFNDLHVFVALKICNVHTPSKIELPINGHACFKFESKSRFI